MRYNWEIDLSSIQNPNKLIFIWIDILGFADALEDESKYRELYSLLRAFQTIFNEVQMCTTTIISDAILLQIDPKGYNKLGNILTAIGESQFKFICDKKYFIRGGIAVGTKYEDNDKSDILVSNGLARAVKIEGKHLDWPIIGTNEKNIKEMRSLLNTDDDEDFGLCRGLNKKGEVIYFIDFIKEDMIYYNLLNDCFKKHEAEPYRDKYIWLLKYYLHHFNKPDNGIPESLQGVIL
jgi:hypothetical protein